MPTNAASNRSTTGLSVHAATASAARKNGNRRMSDMREMRVIIIQRVRNRAVDQCRCPQGGRAAAK